MSELRSWHFSWTLEGASSLDSAYVTGCQRLVKVRNRVTVDIRYYYHHHMTCTSSCLLWHNFGNPKFRQNCYVIQSPEDYCLLTKIHLVTIFWPGPNVVTISNTYCNTKWNILIKYATIHIIFFTSYRCIQLQHRAGCHRDPRGHRVLLHLWPRRDTPDAPWAPLAQPLTQQWQQSTQRADGDEVQWKTDIVTVSSRDKNWIFRLVCLSIFYLYTKRANHLMTVLIG